MEREIERILAPLVPCMVWAKNAGPGALWVESNATHVALYRSAFVKPEVIIDALGLPMVQRWRKRQYGNVRVVLQWGDDLVGMPAAFIAGVFYARLADIPGALTPYPLPLNNPQL